MDRLPPELVIKIATFLSLGTLRNLRLTSSWLANITLPVFAHTIGVLATVDCVKDLQVFLTNTAIANNVKTLKIYHAVWPKCQRNQWATHPLLVGGERKDALRWDDPAVENAADQHDEQRQSHFDRPLREVRVGESPSRPW